MMSDKKCMFTCRSGETDTNINKEPDCTGKTSLGGVRA